MRTKPFNQAVHDACDPPAREAVRKYIKDTWDLNAWHNPKQRGDWVCRDRNERLGSMPI